MPTSRHTDPDTSHQAADDARAGAENGRALALSTLIGNPGGLTDHELAAITGLQHNSIGKRRCDLRDLGLVVDSGLRRKAPSGSNAIVWVAIT